MTVRRIDRLGDQSKLSSRVFRSMPENPFYSVVIPTCNRSELLIKCLDRLLSGAQTLDRTHYEVIVSDDGNNKQTQEIILEKYPEVYWIAGPRKGPAANRNNGASHARGEWLIFTDDDCIPEPNWLKSYAQGILNHPDISVFEGRTFADRARKTLGETCPENETGGYLWSCNFAVRKGLFDALGGFDERFPFAAMEDVDFRYRLVKRGENIVFLLDAAVCHPWRSKAGWKGLKRHQKSTLIYLDIHPEECARISPLHYLRVSFQILRKDTIPGIFKFRGAGMKYEILEHSSNLQMMWKLMLRKHSPAPGHSANVKIPDRTA